MNLIDVKLKEIKQSERTGLMTHVIVGYPTLNDTVALVKTMDKAGVDFVELQIPFTDPLADGPTIMKACEASLQNGTKVADAFVVAKKLSAEVTMPLLFMAYYNTVFRYGVEKFCKDAKTAGISGLIVPDLPLEEEGEEHFLKACGANDLYSVRVVSPASTDERLQKNAAVAKGFVYCAARQGVTGAKSALDPKLTSFLGRVKKYFTVPIAVGFGISKKEHIQALKGHSDVAIVGSALIEVINSSEKKDMLKSVGEFIQKLTYTTALRSTVV